MRRGSVTSDRKGLIRRRLRSFSFRLVTIHDRPEGSKLGTYRYIIEVEYANGITDKLLRKMEAVPEVRFLGSFDVMEKQN